MATTMHWVPNRSAAAFTKSGCSTAAVLILTLSAPAVNKVRISSRVPTPPPTVSGMNTCSAVLVTTPRIVFRFSYEAVMSRKQSSSAPSRSYALAISTGSPASRRFTKDTPFTTRPSFTSRQGMMRLVSMTDVGKGLQLRSRSLRPRWTAFLIILQVHERAREKSIPFWPGGEKWLAGDRRQRGLEVQFPVVERLAHDDSLNAWVERLDGPDVLDSSDPAGRDHRHGRVLHEGIQGREIRSFQHPVSGDIGVDHAGQVQACKRLHQVASRGVRPGRPPRQDPRNGSSPGACPRAWDGPSARPSGVWRESEARAALLFSAGYHRGDRPPNGKLRITRSAPYSANSSAVTNANPRRTDPMKSSFIGRCFS